MTTNAYKYLQNLLGERISLGMAIRAIRNNDNISQGVFAKKLNITQSYLSDIEHNRKQISPKKAAEFATLLGHSVKQFVRLSIQDALQKSGLAYEVDIKDVA